MPTTAPTPAELDKYRAGADRFIAALDQEYYDHYAGLKDELELEPIYREHAELLTLEASQRLGEAAKAEPTQRMHELWRFACEGYLGGLTREHAERVAALESTLEVQLGEQKVGFRMLRPTMANEPKSEERAAIERARNDLTDRNINPLHVEALAVEADALRSLGAPNALALYKAFGLKLDELAAQCRGFLDSTERLYEKAADKLFRERAGVSLSQAQRWDTVRVMRAPEWDPYFKGDLMVPALKATLGDLGINLDEQRRLGQVVVDDEQRPNKSPRAFCSPIEVPGKVMLVIQPMGGADDWRALFHEAGHAEHFAHTSADLPVEARRMGDNAVTEGWAMLLQHLTDEPAWLNRRLDFPRADEFAWEGAATLLFFVRRYCAKLLYELEFHATPVSQIEGLRSRYVELLGDALKIEPSPTDYLSDIDPGFYVSNYLRSWAFEAQIRTHLKHEFGTTWFARREAGGLLRELWSEGQRLDAHDMLKQVTGTEIELEAVAERIREHLK